MKSFLISNILLFLILLTALILRFWQLGKVPPSLFLDEVSNGYNAYSILKTARDEYGNFLPMTFRSFGDYNLALSVYTLVPSIAVFGLNDFAVRFPSALLGTITVFLTYLFALKISQSKRLALTSSLLLAISPWHLQFSRYDHEANFMVFLVLLSVCLFLYSRSYWTFLASIITLGLALNTYHAAKIWIPIFVICLIILYKKRILKYPVSQLAIALIVFAIFTFPIIFNFENSLIRGQSVGILNVEKPINTFISNYLSHYSPNFLFAIPDPIGRHAVPGMGELYIFELPLLLIGLLTLIRHKKPIDIKFLLTWFFLAPIPAALAIPAPHALRSLTFIPTFSIIAAYGVMAIFASQSKPLKYLVISALFLVAAYNVITYVHLYYVHYPKEKAADWTSGYRQMVHYIDSIKDDYTTIAITNYFGHPYINVLFYSRFDPQTYQSQSEDKNKFDKFEFFGPSWEKKKPGKALVVTPPWQAHPEKVLHQVYAPNGDLVFTISEEE